MRPPPLRIALLGCALAAAAGCTVKGHGKSATPAWKTLVTEHPLLSAPRTLRSGDVELRVEAVVLEDRHTVVGPSSWVAVLRGVIVNRGRGPLLPEPLLQAFRFQHRSGVERRGYGFVQGTGGWMRQEKTGERTQLPPGAAGAILVQTESGPDGVRDDPVAVLFEGQRLELR
jgi:hypothetical protein